MVCPSEVRDGVVQTGGEVRKLPLVHFTKGILRKNAYCHEQGTAIMATFFFPLGIERTSHA